MNTTMKPLLNILFGRDKSAKRPPAQDHGGNQDRLEAINATAAATLAVAPEIDRELERCKELQKEIQEARQRMRERARQMKESPLGG